MNSKFFNIIPSGDTATILLYGEIGNSRFDGVRSADMVRELKEAEAAYSKIDVRINSYGGEVFAGIAIFNALRGSGADIRICVDGIAASMASVIALCGKPVEMSRYARLMLHSISGGCYGTKEDLLAAAGQIESLEGTLCEMYAVRTGKSAEEIRAAWFDGKDHYLGAGEALALGLIDGIYDAEAVPEDSTPDEIYQLFNNRLQGPQNNNQMNIEDLRKRPLFKDAATEADAMRIIGNLEAEAGRVAGLSADVARLSGELQVFKDKAKADGDAAKKSLLDAAEADGRIGAQTRPTFQALLDSDFENAKAVMEALPKKKRATEFINRGEGADADGAWGARQKQINEKK
jgi:ATP-dependent Clp endopeptidase proteolytic subunit ClpP